MFIIGKINSNQTLMLLFRTRDHKRHVIKPTDTNGMINTVINPLNIYIKYMERYSFI